jgi:hypothetical protein
MKSAKNKMTFWVGTRINTAVNQKPKFADVVETLYRQYAKLNGNIVGHRLRAPDGATTRQISLALTRVRERWSRR